MTPRLRQYNAGLLTTGIVILTTGIIVPPFAEKFRLDGHCLPECTREAWNNTTGLNVFAGFLHGHLATTAIRFRHFRDGMEQKIILEDLNYDFNFQETRTLQQEVKILPGDHLITECYYRSIHRTAITVGGYKTNQEMCLTFAMYYPKVDMATCESGTDPRGLAKFANVKIFRSNLTVDEPEKHRGRPLVDVLRNDIDWSDENKRDQLHREMTSYDIPTLPLCMGKDFNQLFADPTKPLDLPSMTPLPVPERTCTVTAGADGSVTGSGMGYLLLAACCTMFYHRLY